MKRNNIKQGFLSLAAACLAFTACTGDFERFNTDPNSAQEVDLKMFITTMQMDAVYSCSGSDTEPNNRYQAAYNLIGDVYAGYMSGTNNWNGGTNTQIYALNGTDWCNVPFSESFTNVMPAWLQLKYAHANGLLNDDIFAVANILKVMSLHRVSDIYGPLPVLHFGETENPYNSQEECYMHFFETLDSAIAVLKDVVENNPDAKPLEEVDALYHGDYSKWLKLANSVKLRLAMRICYVKPDLAKQYAMEAVRGGVMETADDSALFQSWGSITIINPLEKIWNGYSDTRMGASMDSYLNGYNDPRLPVYFQPVTDGDNKGEYRGVANGMPNPQQDDYKAMSSPNVQEKSTDSPLRWMMASEVAFLRAEGAMRGWTAEMGGTAEEFYNKGIELSFLENGLSADAAARYAADETSKPTDFTDVSAANTKYNISALGKIAIKWNSGASEEEQLERIITQKWIAMFPNGTEAWSEFRRTGYPRLFPVRYNYPSSGVDTNKQIRRMVFPQSEYSNNGAAVQEAVKLLGGPDNGGTKLWWDKKN